MAGILKEVEIMADKIKYKRVIQVPKKYKALCKEIIADEGFPLEWHDGEADNPDYSSIWTWVPEWWKDQEPFLKEFMKRDG